MISDKEVLRAFVEPSLYPFLVEAYKEKGKGENVLREDIQKARESYKNLVGEERKPMVKNKKGRP
jgi:hypothetical protein